MATGYDSRPSTRQTFAFQPATPAQAQVRDTGQSRGAQVVGGQSAGGAVAVGPQTDAGPVAGQLGQFVEQIMRPHIERRQQEDFFKGFTEAQSGVAVEEIAKSHGGFSKVFGPTSYVQGAEFYTAKAQVDKWAQDNYADIDTLKKLPPAELSKVLAEKSQAMMTGDPFANQLIQSSLIEATAPLVSTVAKARTVWEQSTAKNASTSSWKASAATLQTVAVAQASLSAPTDGETSALRAASQTFLAGMAQPHGMHDDTYVDGMFDFMRGAMQDGNFYAVKLMRNAGIDKIFSADQQTKLADAEHRYGERVMEDASMRLLSGPMTEYEEARILGHLTPMEAAQRLGAMNATVRAATGVDDDLFDFKAVRGEVRSMAEMVKSAHDRAEGRKWALEDRACDRDTRLAEKKAEEADASRAAGAAWASGDINGAEAAGIEAKHFNRIALAEFRGGNLDGLARAFRVGQYVAPAVKGDVQAAVAASVDQQYGETVAKAHRQWKSMYEANPGMAASYYGEWHEKMRTFDTLSRSVGPMAAYTRAFGDAARYSTAKLPPQRRKEAEEGIEAAVNSRQGSSWNPFDLQYSPQAMTVMKNVVRERVAPSLPASRLTRRYRMAASKRQAVRLGVPRPVQSHSAHCWACNRTKLIRCSPALWTSASRQPGSRPAWMPRSTSTTSTRQRAMLPSTSSRMAKTASAATS